MLFRSLIIGRANAGKTSILQSVCNTTQSPVVYHQGTGKKVRGPAFFVSESDLTADQVKLDPSIDVGDNSTSLRLLLNMVPAGRAQHR